MYGYVEKKENTFYFIESCYIHALMDTLRVALNFRIKDVDLEQIYIDLLAKHCQHHKNQWISHPLFLFFNII